MTRPHYAFFQNTQCEFFPCHKGADPAQFNCLFCYCPLYCLGRDCGGAYTYLPNGVKDCSACLYPHRPEHYEAVNAKVAQVAARMKEWEHEK